MITATCSSHWFFFAPEGECVDLSAANAGHSPTLRLRLEERRTALALELQQVQAELGSGTPQLDEEETLCVVCFDSHPSLSPLSHGQVATAAATEAGEVIRTKVGAAVIKTKANPIDLLTEVDGEVQTLLEGAIQRAFPAHGFLVSASPTQSQRSAWREIAWFGKPPHSKADPRQQQEWSLKRLQAGRARPLAACAVATLCCSPPARLGTEAPPVCMFTPPPPSC